MNTTPSPTPTTIRPDALEITLKPTDNKRLANLSGQFDEHLRQLERRLRVEINNRGNRFRIIGDPPATQVAQEILEVLYAATAKEELTPSQVHLVLQQIDFNALVEGGPALSEEVGIQTRRVRIKTRRPSQKRYLDNINQHDINFGIGPAGTGKTYLAVACAVQAFEEERVRRVVLVRPAVEAGENLGFLPGGLAEKVDPYLRPLYDALYEMLGFDQVAKLIERNIIEIAPLAYMRGRSLNEAFVILDEGQNTTVEQMKMFLTRIGFGSTAVITGDVTQVDLPRGKLSGLRQVIEVLRNVKGISFTFFSAQDVVRHPLVQRVVEAYDTFEQNED